MENNDEKREKLDRLERKLYSRNAPSILDKGRSEINLEANSDTIETKEVGEDWQNAKASGFDELAARVSQMGNRKQGFIKKLLIFSVLFFVAAFGVAAFVFLGGMNGVSSKNVDIKVVGPLSTAGGQEVSLDINIINNNNTDLDSASLLVSYATGTRSTVDLSKELNQERFALGAIKSGESVDQNVKAVFFGEKDSVRQIKISLEYRVVNSSALFYKEKTYEISINSAPVIITPTYSKEVNSNQEVSLNIEVASNSKNKLNNFLVNVEYPFGFVFGDATPKASFNNNVWKFSELNPGEKKNIKIKGSIYGQDNEEKVFKINAGTGNPDDERAIAIPFFQSTESFSIKKSFIGLDVFIEGETGDYAAQDSSQINTDFVVRNNLPSKLFNTSVEVALSGGAFDKSGVYVGSNGFFQSFNNTILWDKRSVSDFSAMEPGTEKKLSFGLKPLLYSNITSGGKPEIEMTITTKGERILDSGSSETVSAVEKRKIILASNLDLSSKIVRSIGNLENSGPIPPKIDTPTTYTVIWSIKNSFNQVSNVVVRATLPAYVKWTNIKSPAGEIFSFDDATNEVVWNVGSILPNTGFGSPAKEVAFQLEFLPSLSQVGQTPSLLGGTVLSGIDKVTGLKIESKVLGLTTNFSLDPTFRVGDDKVGQ